MIIFKFGTVRKRSLLSASPKSCERIDEILDKRTFFFMIVDMSENSCKFICVEKRKNVRKIVVFVMKIRFDEISKNVRIKSRSMTWLKNGHGSVTGRISFIVDFKSAVLMSVSVYEVMSKN